MNICPFFLTIGAPPYVVPEAFGIRNIRNSDCFRAGLPEEVWKRISLFTLDFDREAPGADWAPVRDAVRRWEARHAGRTEHLLRYRDGGSFIVISDERGDGLLEGYYEGVRRDVYLECMEIRSFREVCRRFPGSSPEEIREALDGFVEARLMFREGNRHLSLAMAPTPEIAARRIRESRIRDAGEGGEAA